MSKISVSFLIRPNCQLCTEAAPIVERVIRAAEGEVKVVDIDTSDDLLARYGLRIPVVIGPSGQVLAEGIIDERGLRKQLRRAIRSL